MRVPVIKVKDKYSGHEFLVGANHHDKLIINEDGQLHYVNWQCMDGTGADKGYGYEFVGNEVPIDEYSTELHVEFMDVDEYIEMVKKIQKEQEEADKKLKNILGLPERAVIIFSKE